jgi:hypothetical protein
MAIFFTLIVYSSLCGTDAIKNPLAKNSELNDTLQCEGREQALENRKHP